MNESWVNLGGHHINIQKFLDEIKLEQKRNLTNPASISIVLFSSFQVLASIYIVFSPSIQLLFIYLGQYDSFRFAVTEQPGTEKTGTDLPVTEQQRNPASDRDLITLVTITVPREPSLIHSL